jgi:RNA polymerase-associated protein LEO1
MQSETHRMLVRAVGQKHNKVARLRMAPDPTQDPEKEKMELMKQTSKSKPKRQKTEDDGFGNPRAKRKSYSRKRGGDGVWSDDEEEAAYGMYGGESDEDQDLDGGPGRRAGRKGGADQAAMPGREANIKRTTLSYLILPPTTPIPNRGRDLRGRWRIGDRATRTTWTNWMPRSNDRRRLNAKGGRLAWKKNHPEPEEMDVESEEPDEGDEHQVRKAGGKRRRLAVDFEEEE